jgi:hypothetical protein
VPRPDCGRVRTRRDRPAVAKWQLAAIGEKTRRRLQKVRLRDESISDCIIRVIIITHLKRGLL